MIFFHRMMFCAVLVVCFMQGAINEARKDIVERDLLRMTLAELSNIHVRNM